jgi:hypothetical protein
MCASSDHTVHQVDEAYVGATGRMERVRALFSIGIFDRVKKGAQTLFVTDT